MLSRRLDLLSVTESWLTSNDYHCRPHEFTWRLRFSSLTKFHSQRRWICCYRTQRASCFAKWRLYFFFVRTFWFNYHLWQQGFSPSESTSTSTVQEKWLYSRKVFLRILCVIRRVDCYFLSIPSLWWFQLSRRYRLKCKRQTILWPFSFGWYVILCASSSGTHLGTGRRAVKKPFVLWNAPLRRRQLYWRTLTLSFLWNCGLTPLHMVWVPLLYSFISTETAAWLPTRHKLWMNTTKHSVTTSDLFHRSEIQWLMCYNDCPCPPRLTKRMLFIEWKNVWFICYPSQTRR